MLSHICDRIFDSLTSLLPPGVALSLRAKRYFRRAPELRLAVALCRPDRAALDVGANAGLFSYYFARHSAECVAFEPNGQLAAQLAKAMPNVTVHAIGLADSDGERTLSIPVVDGVPYAGYASMATTSMLAKYPHQSVTVPVRRLDSFGLRDIGLIKIDVEGFEEQVLAGGAETIARDRPALIIEIEERHNPGGLSRITSALSGWGYGPKQPVAGAENNYVFLPGT